MKSNLFPQLSRDYFLRKSKNGKKSASAVDVKWRIKNRAKLILLNFGPEGRIFSCVDRLNSYTSDFSIELEDGKVSDIPNIIPVGLTLALTSISILPKRDFLAVYKAVLCHHVTARLANGDRLLISVMEEIIDVVCGIPFDPDNQSDGDGIGSILCQIVYQ